MSVFKTVIVVMGLFIVATGLLEAVVGPDLLPGDQQASPTVDSNYRFFAVSWMALGFALLSVVRRVRESALVVRAVSATVFVGGLARIVSMVVAGDPHPMMYMLLGIELVVPPLLVLWHNRLVVTN